MNSGTIARKSGWLLLPVLLVVAGAAWCATDPGLMQRLQARIREARTAQ